MQLHEIPKFRKSKRLVEWVRNNSIHERLPAEREEVFRKEHAEGKLSPTFITQYSAFVGPLPDMEHMLMGVGPSIIQYAKNIRVFGAAIGDALRDSLPTDADLLGYAKLLGRLPGHLESRISDPGVAVTYSAFIRERLPEEMELRIFSDKTAFSVMKYVKDHGILPSGHLYECLKGGADTIVEYMKYLRPKGLALPDEMRDLLAGKDDCLYEWAKLNGRLPEHLERTLGKPSVCLEYAVNVLRGRLPLAIEEEVLTKDYAVAIQYGFKVMRGFAPVRLPEVVHTSIMAQSFAFPDNPEIKRYVAACDSDPNRTGNAAQRNSW
jgi:hypothetical protein